MNVKQGWASRRNRMLVGALAWMLVHSAWAAETLTKATDLTQDGAWVRQQQGVLVLMFSRQDCRYCEVVRRDYLIPLQHDARYREQVRIRQIDQDSAEPLRDFAGQMTRHDDYARLRRVRMVPVVLFVDEQGKSLTSPLVGLRLPDFYQSYLEDALNTALKARSATNPPAASVR